MEVSSTICFLMFVGWLTAPAYSQIVHHGDCEVDAEILVLPKCALEIKSGRLYVSHRYVWLYFQSSDSPLAPIHLPDDSGWGYINRQGRVLVKHVAAFDNGASDFHRGLVRIAFQNKWGLARADGSTAVPLKYDGMLEYQDGKGWKACVGCHLAFFPDQENSWFEGGEWFWLDDQGNVKSKAEEDRSPAP